MKILYYDCFCGISGDMNLGAMVDLGVDGDYLINELSKLNLDSEYTIDIKKSIKNGISGTKVDVVLTHGDHDHTEHADHHHHRRLKDIETIINSSGLSDRVKEISLNMFLKIAEAEGKVHGVPDDEVHFHEVGAVDSIVDMVGAAIAFDYLKADRILASPVQVGGGFVKCAHGLIPVPGPATAELLKGIPMRTGIVPFETTTPTGAAILAANADKFTDKMEFSVQKIGYGLGSQVLEIPNVLRVYLGESDNAEETDRQCIIETNIDDMNPELYGYIEERLFEAGALDVFKTPVIMKKGRPAIKLSVLVGQKAEKDALKILFTETTSIGVRKYAVDKIMLHREFLTVKTKYGEITVKCAYFKGEPIKYKAEFEDCKRIAAENEIPLAEIYREVDRAMENCKLKQENF